MALLRSGAWVGLLLVALATGAAHAGQAGSSFNVSVNYVAGGSGSCGLLRGPKGMSYVACANVPVASAGWLSVRTPHDANQTDSDYVVHIGPYRLHGALHVFAPAASTDPSFLQSAAP